MKNITRMHFVLFFAFVVTIPCALNASSFVVSKPTPGYSGDWKNLKANEFVALSVNEFSRLIGKRMNMNEKVSFILLKKEMKRAAKMNPDLTVNQYLSAPHKLKKGWKIFIIITSVVVSLLITYLLIYHGVNG